MLYVGDKPQLVKDWEWFSSKSKTVADSRAIINHLVTKNNRILDCPCGAGLMSCLLSCAGNSVTGIDCSQRYLDLAREQSLELKTDVAFLRKDMSQLHGLQKYDHIINWNNSFGYFEHETNKKILVNFHKMLNEKGSLMIECENMDAVSELYPRDFSDESDMYWNPTDYTMHYRYGDIECIRIQYPIHILKSLLKEAGFKEIYLYGSMFSVFTPESERVIIEAVS